MNHFGVKTRPTGLKNLLEPSDEHRLALSEVPSTDPIHWTGWTDAGHSNRRWSTTGRSCKQHGEHGAHVLTGPEDHFQCLTGHGHGQ